MPETSFGPAIYRRRAHEILYYKLYLIFYQCIIHTDHIIFDRGIEDEISFGIKDFQPDDEYTMQLEPVLE